MNTAALSLLMLAMMALVLGAVVLLRRDGYRRQALLMLVLAGIMAVNVAIWTLPTREGKTLADEAQKERAPK